MSYYLRTADNALPQVWWIDDTEARRIGVGDAKLVIGGYFKANPGEDIWDAMMQSIAKHQASFDHTGRISLLRRASDPASIIPVSRDDLTGLRMI